MAEFYAGGSAGGAEPGGMAAGPDGQRGSDGDASAPGSVAVRGSAATGSGSGAPGGPPDAAAGGARAGSSLADVPYDLGHGFDDQPAVRRPESVVLARRLRDWVRGGTAGFVSAAGVRRAARAGSVAGTAREGAGGAGGSAGSDAGPRATGGVAGGVAARGAVRGAGDAADLGTTGVEASVDDGVDAGAAADLATDLDEARTPTLAPGVPGELTVPGQRGPADVTGAAGGTIAGALRAAAAGWGRATPAAMRRGGLRRPPVAPAAGAWIGRRPPRGRGPGIPGAPRPRGSAASWAAALVLAFAVGLWAGGAAFTQPPPATAAVGAATASPAPSTPAPVRIIRSVPTSAKAIALTFDDGPSPKYTPQVLQLLSEYGAHATFFVIGQEVERYPQILKAEVDAGDEIGNHGYHHLALKNVSTSQLMDEVQTAEQTLVSLTGSDPTLYRLPGGKSDPAALRQLTDLGYKIVMWSIDTRDYVFRAPAAIVAQVEKEVAPGAIVIFHDGGGNQQHTIDALKVLLPWLKEQGYQMTTVSQLLAMPRAAVTH